MKDTNQLFMNTNYKLLQFTLASLVSCLFFTSSLTAQTEKIAFEKFGVTEGLPEEFVTSIVQDDQGYMWFATQNGLVKFDGYNMKVFRGTSAQDSTNLLMRNTNNILKSRDGKLWVSSVLGGDEALASYNPITELFTNYVTNINDSTKIPYKNTNILFEDVSKNIWFTSYSVTNSSDNFLCKINPKTQKVTRYPYSVGNKRNDIVLNFQIAESKRDSTIWLRTQDKSILSYNKTKDVFEIQFKKGDIIPGTTYKDSIVDINSANKSGLITLTNNDRMFLFDPILRRVVETYEFSKRSNISWGAQFEDKNGDFWVSSHDNLTLINRENKQRQDFKFGEAPLDFKMNGNVLQILPQFQNDDFILFEVQSQDTNNSRFLNTLRYNLKTMSFEFFDSNFNDVKNIIGDVLFRRTYALDNNGLLWIGTRPNFYKQAPKLRQMELYKHDEDDANTIPSDDINVLFEDSKNRLWIGTQSGLSLKSSNDDFQEFHFRDNSGTKKEFGNIFKIYEDSKGNIWVSCINNGLFKLNETTQEFESINYNLVVNIQEDSQGNIWINSFNNGVYVLESSSFKLINKFEPDARETHGLLSNRIRLIFLDSRGTMWLGDSGENRFGLFKYIEDENRFKHYERNDADSTTINSYEIHDIIEDDLQRMWVSTDDGINLYDHENDIFYKNKQSFDISSVGTSIKATNGKVWVATYASGGLALVGPGIDDIEMFGEDKGLLHNDVGNPIFDDLGKLWLPTERGLSVLDTLTKTYTSYFEKDGFQKSIRGSNPILKTQNGDIWIGGQDGLNHIVPNKLSKKSTTLPSVYITDMNIMDSIYSAPDGEIFTKAVSYTDKATLKYWQKDVSFNFVGIHYLSPEDNQYSWKLENYDTNWSTPSKERRAAYTNLSPGTYTFHVKASNADGVWNEEGATIKIIISPPWWLTWWAYVIYAIIALLIGLKIHKTQKEKTLRLARERAQQKELEQAKEIEKAYTSLKATQSQLIQSEKMASLGELTAGIAHEIQNPLNFVNNFAEVNSELIEEMKEELDNGNLKEVQSLADDINGNEKKIMFHGKRADSIVKGMLQHSRSSNGKKEPTNINALADEYLRLAYHGLRAKDKSFNASMVTDFDDTIGTIDIIPQDIGRVILNLITNAFYVVDEKKKSGLENYEPTVTVSSKKVKDTIEIEVIDNGNGIPEHILNKIFEPFFTTKPAGKGTGLGLSMSYDIVTKGHGGELKVETKEGEGTTFIIELPKI